MIAHVWWKRCCQSRSPLRPPVQVVAVSLVILTAAPLLGQGGTGQETVQMPEASRVGGLASPREAALYTGAATSSIPINVPPGRNGLNPNLSLRYASRAGPSPYGLGWTLPIARVERDPKFGALSCPFPGEAKHRFVLNFPDQSVPCFLDLGSGGKRVCRTRVEGNFLRVEFDESTGVWEVRDKFGFVYRFGEPNRNAWLGSSSGPQELYREAGYDEPCPPEYRESSDPVESCAGWDWRMAQLYRRCLYGAAWLSTSVQDANGNSMEFFYDSPDYPYDPPDYPVPVAIRYGGHAGTGLPHRFEVKFEWEQRPAHEVLTLQAYGLLRALRKRLQRIRIRDLQTALDVRAYHFYYEDNVGSAGTGRTNRTRIGRRWALTAVTITGSQGGVLLRADGKPAGSVFGYNELELDTSPSDPLARFSGEASMLYTDGPGDWRYSFKESDSLGAPIPYRPRRTGHAR